MSQLVEASTKGFDLAYYNCNGWQAQWLRAGLEWDVEIDAANRRYRVKGRAKLTRSWSGMTSFTVRERVVHVGTTTQSLPDYSLPMNSGQTVFDMSDWVYSEWFPYDDDGKATVTSVPVGFRCCFNHYTRAAGGNCYDLRYDCYGDQTIAHVDPSGIANGGSPGGSYTDVSKPSITCSATGPRSAQARSTVDYGKGKEGENRMSMSGAMSCSTTSTTLNCSTSSLQPNQRYTVTATATNGVSSASSSCEFVTLCENTLSNCRSIKSDEIMVDCTIAGGYGVYPPTTVFRYRKAGTSNWQEFFNSKTKTKTTATAQGLQRDTSYEFQACTQTTAGTYCGNIVTCKTTPGAYAIIDSTDPYIEEYPNNEKPQNTRCTVCYSWNADCAPVDLQVFYRVKNGFDDKWLWSEVFTTDQKTGSNCITLIDLVPNGTVYECYVEATGCDGVSWDSPVAEFTTPLLKRPYDYNCETLTYMADLICQALEAIKKGNKTIYANSDSMEKCDPYSENPTLATLWSRFLRWGAGSACLMCDMIDFVIKSGKKNQYFVGEIGWVDILDHIEDEYDSDDDDQYRLVMSGAVRQYIMDKIHTVWHYHGAVDYGVDTLDDAPDDAKIVLNFEDDKVYEKVGGEWVVSTTIPQPDDFAVYHFNKEHKTKEVGTIKAESAWYYWAGTWNNLDVDIEWMVKVVDEMYSHVDEFTYTEKCTPRIMVSTQPYDRFDCSLMTQYQERGLCYILEPLEIAQPGHHLIKFFTGADATIIQNQEVLDGALAQRPNDPEKYCMDFVQWEDATVPGVPFDWDTIILRDYDLTAIWAPHPVKMEFDIGPKGLGTVPSDINKFCGDKIGTLPNDNNFSRPGGTFRGWMVNGVPIDSDWIIEEDCVAEAIWEMEQFNVTFHPENGEPNIVTVVTYDEYAIPPVPDPTWTDYLFNGWWTAADGGTQFDFNNAIYANTDIYAQWIYAYVTITFDSNGGSSVPSQTIDYGTTATQPDDPTMDGFMFKRWVDQYGNEFDFAATPLYEDITLYAEWSATWDVKFNANGGSPAPLDQMVEDGDIAERPLDPSKDGAEFVDWYLDGQPYDFENTPVTGNITLEAIWQYSVEFDADGGDPTPPTQKVHEGEKATKPADPTKDGFEFDCWEEE